jgi:hypothetical protein
MEKTVRSGVLPTFSLPEVIKACSSKRVNVL